MQAHAYNFKQAFGVSETVKLQLVEIDAILL